MAGHSKFKNIMHRKGAQDKARAKLFTRLGKEISVATKIGGADLNSNARLKSAVSSAKSLNMPKDNINRAIKKGTGNDPDANFEEIRYEGYGPSGSAIIVEALTNNKNRTASEIRTIFGKNGGVLAENGSVSYNFKKIGVIKMNINVASEEEIFNFSIENKSTDVETNTDNYLIFCDVRDYHELLRILTDKFGHPMYSKIIWKSDSNINIKPENAETLFKLINILEDNEDVQSVSSNFKLEDKNINEI